MKQLSFNEEDIQKNNPLISMFLHITPQRNGGEISLYGVSYRARSRP